MPKALASFKPRRRRLDLDAYNKFLADPSIKKPPPNAKRLELMTAGVRKWQREHPGERHVLIDRLAKKTPPPVSDREKMDADDAAQCAALSKAEKDKRKAVPPPPPQKK